MLRTVSIMPGMETGAEDRTVYGQIERFKRAVAKSVSPLYLALGNHDIAQYGITEAAKLDSDQSFAGEAR
ncbi:MAG: hypothetical protein Q8O16_02040, partial [Dehalococcoidia bacterium]|nr:hypothetical protein [Dehalococcoidia bacterium]